MCQNTPQLCWGDEWPPLSPGGRGLEPAPYSIRGWGGNDLFITPTLILPPQRLCRNQRETASVATRNRRSGDEALEREPFIAQLRGTKPMKRNQFLRRPSAHNFKRPHSKVEGPDCLFRRNLPPIMITTQPLKGEEGFLENWMPRSSAAGHFTPIIRLGHTARGMRRKHPSGE